MTVKVLAWATGKMKLQLIEMGKAVSRAGLGFCRGHVEFEVPVTHIETVVTVRMRRFRDGSGLGYRWGAY